MKYIFRASCRPRWNTTFMRKIARLWADGLNRELFKRFVKQNAEGISTAAVGPVEEDNEGYHFDVLFPCKKEWETERDALTKGANPLINRIAEKFHFQFIEVKE